MKNLSEGCDCYCDGGKTKSTPSLLALGLGGCLCGVVFGHPVRSARHNLDHEYGSAGLQMAAWLRRGNCVGAWAPSAQ